jgi:hypothetical protein
LTTELVNDRNTGLKIGFEATDWSQPVSFDDYALAVKDWIIKTVARDGVPIGAFYQKGDEIHFSIKPEWRRKWFTKGLKREVFDKQRVTTKVTPGHDYMIPILERMGFKDDGTGLMVKEYSNGH